MAPKKIERLTAGGVYHLYNRGINRALLFFEPEHYRHFMRLYRRHVHPHVETLAYCLMPNHFHLLVRVREGADALPAGTLLSPVEAGLRTCFMAYAKGINAQQQRVSALFQANYKRRQVGQEAYFTRLIHYLHANPVRARLAATPAQWPFSSYQALLSPHPTLLNRDEVLAWFGGVEALRQFTLDLESTAAVRQYLWRPA